MDNLKKLGRFDRRLPQPQNQMINVNNDELDILIYFDANPKNSVTERKRNWNFRKQNTPHIEKYKFKSFDERAITSKITPR